MLMARRVIRPRMASHWSWRSAAQSSDSSGCPTRRCRGPTSNELTCTEPWAVQAKDRCEACGRGLRELSAGVDRAAIVVAIGRYAVAGMACLVIQACASAPPVLVDAGPQSCLPVVVDCDSVLVVGYVRLPFIGRGPIWAQGRGGHDASGVPDDGDSCAAVQSEPESRLPAQPYARGRPREAAACPASFAGPLDPMPADYRRDRSGARSAHDGLDRLAMRRR